MENALKDKEKDTVTTTIRKIPKDVWDAVRIQAVKRDMEIGEYVVDVLRKAALRS